MYIFPLHLLRTVTSGFNTIRVRSSFIIDYCMDQVYLHRCMLVVRETICAGVIRPVETTYFIRTVVCAISCTDTTVISHLVDAFAAVVGCSYRANVFTGSVIAMLAKHRLENSCTLSGSFISPLK